MSNERGKWGSSIGFVLAAAGSAIGLGNLWKFPYLAGKNGGGAFVLVYLSLIVILGFSLMLGEMAIGRRGKSDAYGSYNNIKKGWGVIGVLGILACFLIYSYYVVIAGWILKYIGIFVTGGLSGDPVNYFSDFIASGTSPIIYSFVVLVVTAAIVLKGVAGGIEKASKIMMPILFVFMLVIVVRSVTLPNASVGIKYFLKPDFSLITPQVVIAALGQVFFSLSLGMGVMVTYGSYLPSDTKLIKSAFYIPVLDTAIALLAGLAILPAVFSFGLEPTAGPGLIFITLPKVFSAMPFGNIFGIIFFLLVLFAALTSTISLLEVVVSFVVDQFKMDRKKATLLVSVLIGILAIPNSNSFGSMADVKVFFGMNFFDFLGYVTDNLLLPAGGLFLCIFIGFVWNRDEVKKEITNDGEIEFPMFSVWMIGVKYLGIQLLSLILLQAVGVQNTALVYALLTIFVVQILCGRLEGKRGVKTV
ncbi:sodium-dependent transporter [uncultured Cetobacterium sp.]|uniref:sodium-dependent transporter n=1 Tax=uncultured Cetobacterium sp. TaxID=527638 RepID=UPI00262AC375|nr:sodium-dependent transporter [uncultured Cetobacterium sp.]